MTTFHNPKQLLEQFGLDPKKSLGQNFLHDPNALARIVEIAELPLESTILEIGAGTGALTRILATHVRELVIVETDERLRPVLNFVLSDLDNITYYWQDFLDIDLNQIFADKPYFVVANLPYYITSKILRTLLEATNRPQRIVVTVQREVADRILAPAGDLSLLAVSVQFYADVKLHMRLNPAVFYPRPDVESAVIRLDVHPQPKITDVDTEIFFRVVRAGFSQKRKQLKNALANGLSVTDGFVQSWLAQAQIDAKRRAETLTLEEWGVLAKIYAEQTA
jgi:16S rRNA (adenine1518-N6/adenine1519-N6)-dimethyltransferase